MLPNLVCCNPLPRPLTQPLMDFWCHTHGLSFPVCICLYHVLFGTPFTQIHACDSFSYPGGKLHHFASYNTAAQPQIMCFVNVLPYWTSSHNNRLLNTHFHLAVLTCCLPATHKNTKCKIVYTASLLSQLDLTV